MAPLNDPERLRCYLNALANWGITGYVNFLKHTEDWLRAELAHLPAREVSRLLHDYVAAGGTIDEQVETREHWRELYEFHHDLRLPIGGRVIYFETRLIYRHPDDPDDPVLYVVNIHDA